MIEWETKRIPKLGKGPFHCSEALVLSCTMLHKWLSGTIHNCIKGKLKDSQSGMHTKLDISACVSLRVHTGGDQFFKKIEAVLLQMSYFQRDLYRAINLVEKNSRWHIMAFLPQRENASQANGNRSESKPQYFFCIAIFQPLARTWPSKTPPILPHGTQTEPALEQLASGLVDIISSRVLHMYHLRPSLVIDIQLTFTHNFF